MKWRDTGGDFEGNEVAGRDIHNYGPEFPKERGCYYKTANGAIIAIILSLFITVILFTVPGAREDTASKLREWGILGTSAPTATSAIPLVGHSATDTPQPAFYQAAMTTLQASDAVATLRASDAVATYNAAVAIYNANDAVATLFAVVTPTNTIEPPTATPTNTTEPPTATPIFCTIRVSSSEWLKEEANSQAKNMVRLPTSSLVQVLDAVTGSDNQIWNKLRVGNTEGFFPARYITCN